MKKITIILIASLLLQCTPQKISIGMRENFLATEMEELKGYIPQQENINTDVSQVSVGWHVAHLLLTITEIHNALKTSNPEAYRYRFNITRTMMFIGNQIPRGRATAPEVVRPKGSIDITSLSESYAFAKSKTSTFDSLPENAFFRHPAAGYFNRDDAKRFLAIHTEHHLKIIRDILIVSE